jgi:phage head maturation protease
VRSFESNGKRYVYGYAALFTTPDAFGTIISKQLVENNLDRLRRFPVLRFMHRDPIGKILFDKEVEGVRTFIDEHGFHVLAEVSSTCEKEWNLIRDGVVRGFSYALANDSNLRIERRRFGNKEYDVFVNGTIYEISIVDSPAHPEAVAHVVNRSLIPLAEPPNYIEEYQKSIFPQICSADCPFITCQFRRPQNFNRPCLHQWEQYRSVPKNWIINEGE